MNSFEEIQRVRKTWWYWAISIPLTVFCSWSIINLLGAKDEAQISLPLILLSSIPIALTVFLFFSGLKTTLNENEIVIKLFPLFITKTIPWNQVTKVFIRKYEWSEFKATGLGAIPLGSRGTAYHLFGEYGLQIETIDGDKILIGTRKPKSVSEFLKRLNKL